MKSTEVLIPEIGKSKPVYTNLEFIKCFCILFKFFVLDVYPKQKF